jgi:hypothetical protein
MKRTHSCDAFRGHEDTPPASFLLYQGDFNLIEMPHPPSFMLPLFRKPHSQHVEKGLFPRAGTAEAGGRALIPKNAFRWPNPRGFCRGGVFLLSLSNFYFPFSIFQSGTAAKGFSMRSPAIFCPGFKSSERSRAAPLLAAAATMRASQKPI